MINLKKSLYMLTGLLTVFAACSNSNAEPNPTPTIDPVGNVSVLVTTVYRTKDLTKDAVNFSNKDNLAPTNITIDPATRYQEIDGFGAAITGSTCYNLLKMNAADRKEFLTKTFSPNAYGFSYVRISIGCSDFSLSEYTCCDKEGIDNFALTDEETDLVIPILKEILAINPSLKIMGSPWTAPKWMKVDNLTDLNPYDSWTGGQLNPAYYATYAAYFVKWIQAFKAQGIDIYSITPQNEPLNRGNSASMYMSWEEERDFIRTALGPQFVANGIKTKIYVFDHNYNYDNIASQQSYPTNIYADADAAQYIAGAAFHDYGGDRSELLNVHNANPDKELVFSESSIGTWNSGRDLTKRLVEDMRNITIGTVNNWCRGAIVWNLMLDNDRSPYREGGCSTCYGAVDINNRDYKTITLNSHYYIMAHMGAVVKPGAVRIGTSGYTDSNMAYAAFENTDGTIAFVLANNNEKSKLITVTIGEKHFAYEAPGKSVASFKWAK